MLTKTNEIRIKKHFKKFLEHRIESIEKLSARDLEINPFLISTIKHQFNINSTYDLAEWLVKQRIERGTVTGFGNTLQNIAKEFSNEKPFPGLTMRLKKNGKTYNLMIKSGPNPYPMQPAKDMEKILLDSKKTDPNSIPIFCMCYGNEDAVSSVVKTHMNNVKRLVGKEFWAFISGDPNCRKKILTIAKELGDNYKDQNGNSINNLIELKIKYVEKELKKLYGNEQQAFWKNIFQDIY